MITIEELRSKNIMDAINLATSQYGEIITTPSKPRLELKHTTADVLEYAEKMKLYDIKYEAYKMENNKKMENMNAINAILEKHIEEEAGLDIVPEQYRIKVWNKACLDSSGYYEIYNNLVSLIEIFDI